MQKMQRTMGRLLSRTADETDVTIILNDFERADKVLFKVGWPGACLEQALLTEVGFSSSKPQSSGEMLGETY
jgi:hypothetical protein